jgi:hypothetical protein
MARYFLIAVLVLIAHGVTNSTGAQDPQPRLWKDVTGNFQVHASLVDQSDKSVRLRTQDAREINVPIERLSLADREYLKSLTAPSDDPFAGGKPLNGDSNGGGAADSEIHQVRLPDGYAFRGTWHEIVRQMRDHAGFCHEPIAHYMRRLAERWHEQSGIEIPFQDPEGFLQAAIRARLVHLEEGGGGGGAGAPPRRGGGGGVGKK